jgi:hypothetical protein
VKNNDRSSPRSVEIKNERRFTYAKFWGQLRSQPPTLSNISKRTVQKLGHGLKKNINDLASTKRHGLVTGLSIILYKAGALGQAAKLSGWQNLQGKI